MDKTDIVHALNQYAEKLNIYTITNRRVSLWKICHEWPNNAVTYECARRMIELQRSLVMSHKYSESEIIVFI